MKAEISLVPDVIPCGINETPEWSRSIVIFPVMRDRRPQFSPLYDNKIDRISLSTLAAANHGAAVGSPTISPRKRIVSIRQSS